MSRALIKELIDEAPDHAIDKISRLLDILEGGAESDEEAYKFLLEEVDDWWEKPETTRKED